MRRFVIAERSMAPALNPGDRLLAFRRLPPRRGALVFFSRPASPDFWLVKRIVGLPGERVAIRDGAVIVDAVPIDEPWTTDAVRPDGEWTVPDDHVFALSDARSRSTADSRTYGPIPLAGAYVGGLRYRRGR